MRYLGLDLGTKTLGIAVSDITGTIATSIITVRYQEEQELFLKIQEMINSYQIKKIVLGFPKNMNNTIGPKAEEAIIFQKKLQDKFSLEVILQDERLSTVSAHNAMILADVSRKKRKEKVDSVAATIILQTYLDKKGKDL